MMRDDDDSFALDLAYGGSRVSRVPNTFEMSDFLLTTAGEESDGSCPDLTGSTAPPSEAGGPCYRIECLMNLNEQSQDLEKLGEEGDLGQVLDMLALLSPDYCGLTELKELSAEDFISHKYHAPPGYVATTRVFVGRMATPALNDAGASCSCVAEEQVVFIVNHVRHMLDTGQMT